MGQTKWIKMWLIKKIIEDMAYFSLSFELRRDISRAFKFFGVRGCVFWGRGVFLDQGMGWD